MSLSDIIPVLSSYDDTIIQVSSLIEDGTDIATIYYGNSTITIKSPRIEKGETGPQGEPGPMGPQGP